MESLRQPGPHVQFCCCFFFLCLRMLLFLQSALSAPEVPTYHTLDVATSLRGTDTVPGGVEYKRKSKPRRTPWSLDVVHRDTLLPANASWSYEQQWEEILRRDAARIRVLEQQIERRLNKSAGSYENVAADFGGGVVSGLPLRSGGYLARIGIGTPTRGQCMVLNTGSDVIWVQCKPCRRCYSQMDPIFNPTSSTSFSTVPCNSTICSQLEVSGCQTASCLYRVDYLDGSYTVGSMATEKLTFGTSVSDVAMGCGHKNVGLFRGTAGLLGLGAGKLSLPSQLRNQTGSNFSYCLPGQWSKSYGTLEFGSQSVPDGSFFTAMLINSYIPTFYYLSRRHQCRRQFRRLHPVRRLPHRQDVGHRGCHH